LLKSDPDRALLAKSQQFLFELGRASRSWASNSGSHSMAGISKDDDPAASVGCEGLRAGFLAMLGGLGGDGGGAFGADLDPGLEGLLLLGNDGCGHVAVPRPGGISDDNAMSSMKYLAQIIKISLKFCECNELPSLVCKNAAYMSAGTKPATDVRRKTFHGFELAKIRVDHPSCTSGH
jgi:hypothetical protein